MTIEQILEIIERYKLRMPPTVYYELLADVRNEQEPTTKNDLGVDCISRKQAIEEADKLTLETGYDNEKVEEMLRDLPSVTPQEPKTGHRKSYLKEGLRYQCSDCDSRFDTPWEYCPHCGAKMEEE